MCGLELHIYEVHCGETNEPHFFYIIYTFLFVILWSFSKKNLHLWILWSIFYIKTFMFGLLLSIPILSIHFSLDLTFIFLHNLYIWIFWLFFYITYTFLFGFYGHVSIQFINFCLDFVVIFVYNLYILV